MISSRFSIITLLSILCIIHTVSLAEDKNDIESARHALKRLESQVKKIQLANGLRVLLYRRGIAPVFAGVIEVRVGGVNEPSGATGIAHLLEHMAFKGTPDIGTKDSVRERVLLKELESLVDKHGSVAAISGQDRVRWNEIQEALNKLTVTGEFVIHLNKHGASGLNATTGVDSTNYFMNLPRTAFEYWCLVESERLLKPVMRQFYQELEVVREERRMRNEDNPGGKLYEALLGVAFWTHPYRNPVIGYDFDIQSLTATKVENFRRQYYVPGNIVLAVVGDIDFDRDPEIIERYFGRIPPGPLPMQPDFKEVEQNGERQFIVRANASPQIAIAYKKPVYPHPDDPPLSLMLDVLSGGSISPMHKKLVKEKKILTSVSAFEAPGTAYPNIMAFHGVVRAPHSTDEALQGFDAIIEEFIKEGVSQEHFDIAKKRVAVSYLNDLDSNMSVAMDLAGTELLHGDWRVLAKWYEEVMNAKPADVNRVARQYLVHDKRTVGRLEREQ